MLKTTAYRARTIVLRSRTRRPSFAAWWRLNSLTATHRPDRGADALRGLEWEALLTADSGTGLGSPGITGRQGSYVPVISSNYSERNQGVDLCLPILVPNDLAPADSRAGRRVV